MKPINILICEDEQICALDLKTRVEQLGHHVVGIVANHNDAISVSRKEKPDLVLMDVYLHGQAVGLDTARELENTLHIPSIFISGSSEREILEDAHKAHPLAYLLKPVDDKDLELAIEFGMDQHRIVDGLQRDLRLYQALFEREEQIEGPKIESAEILRDVVGAVAHELSSTLVSAISELQWLGDSSSLQPLEKRCARGVQRLCEDAHRLIQRLLWASQEGPRDLSIVLVTELIHEVEQRLQHWAQPIEKLAVTFSQDDLVVFCDRQAIINAILGAVVSMASSRRVAGPIEIHVSSEEGHMPDEEVGRGGMSAGYDYVVIALKSSGIQLTLEEVEAMTKSFTAERLVPEQVGLGLAVAYGVAKAHGGWIEVDSHPELGTTISLFLPQVKAH